MKIKTMNNCLFIILLFSLALVSGCVEQSDKISGQGIRVVSFEPEFSEVDGGETVELFLDLENTGRSTAKDVSAFLYGLNFENEWKLLSDNPQKLGAMEGVDPVTNSPGDIKYTSWTLEAPSIPKDMTNTYKPKVRIFYTYKTTASTSIPILSKNKYQRLKQLRKTLPRQAQTLVSGGPLDVQIYTETPVITKSKTFTVKTTIRNLRGGSVFNSTYTTATTTTTTLPSTTTTTIPATNEIAIFLLKDISTCIVGDKCTDACINVTRKDGTTYMQFEDNDNFKALRPSDPSIDTYEQKVCLNTTLNNSEIDFIKNEINEFISNVYAWSGAIGLSPKFIEISGEMDMTKYGTGLWIAPCDSRDLIKPYITRNTDFIIVSNDMYDNKLDLVIPVSACGLSYGPDMGVGGAGYSWVPKTPFWFEYDKTYIHEWLHNLDSALEKVMYIPDIYSTLYPDGFPESLCGHADPDPHKWFPNPDFAATDPDFPACQNHYGDWGGYCDSIKPEDCDYKWDEHLLRDHYNSTWVLIGNHCRNGIKDFTETGVDCGGECEPCETPSTASVIQKLIEKINPTGEIIAGDIDTKDLNWIRIKITTPLEAKDCPGLGEYAYIRTRAGETVHNCELIMPDVETMENMPFIVELEYGYFFDISTAIRVRGE
ncbi:MAG: hypothetical protein J7J38_01145 [Candidatus Aenigmarchaeota archaeon]|nr:hypothetical protein [Candidatus Aenigmarchaeota archaeon]